MASVTDRSASSDTDRSTPRRSAQQQARSRATRRKLIRAALELWNERGFERALEETTAEEIARAAGVSKGTFYFHFAHKEDILLEMPWVTGEIMSEEAEAAMQRGEATFELVDQLMVSLARRVARAPRAAVLRVIGPWSRVSYTPEMSDNPAAFGPSFRSVMRYGRDRGDLPRAVDISELAAVLQAATMDALLSWAATTQSSTALRTTLCRRADVILRGAVVSYGS